MAAANSPNFDANKALDYTTFLAKPRLVGSPGEQQAQEYIARKLQEFGYQVDKEWFDIGLAPWHVSLLYTMLGLTLLFLAWAVEDSYPLLAIAMLGLIVLVIATGGKYWLWLIETLTPPQAGLKSKNIAARLDPANPAANPLRVFLLAHYDSKSQTISLPARIICLGVTLVSLAALIILLGIEVFHPATHFWYTDIFFALAGISGIRLAVVKTGNDSPGALDNAASAATLLELARIYRNRPLENVQLNFIFTGAEEWGLMGAAAFLKEHAAELSKDKGSCRFLNLDGIGIAGRLAYLAPGVGAKELLPQLKQAAAKANLPMRKMWLTPGLMMDHQPFARRGFVTASLCCVGRNSYGIHTPKDTVSLVSTQGLEETGRLLQTWLEQTHSGQ